MRIFVAGATGALGRRLVPMLIERGHAVTGMTRSPDKADELRARGAEATVADALDRSEVAAAVKLAGPEVVVHELTALAGVTDFKDIDAEFELTNRLRTEGTDHLLAAARDGGARRFVAQSFAGWPFARTGSWVKTEDDPLDPNPPAKVRRALAAIRHLETAVTAAARLDGLVLRYGGFYGPGTSLDRDGQFVKEILARRFPLVGRGTGIWSFVHIDDAASATLAAIEGGRPGLYNVVDDEPAPVSEWLPALAGLLGARPPRHVPAWLARMVAGEAAVVWMTEARGASNAKAKRELGWRPRYPSWRAGFREVLGKDRDDRAVA